MACIQSFKVFSVALPAALVLVSAAFPAAATPASGSPASAPTPVSEDCPCAKEPRGPEPLYEAGSLLVRVTAGPGYLLGKGDPDTEMKSASGGLGMAIGGFILKGFALHGDIAWVQGFDPDFSAGGTIDNRTSMNFHAASFHLGASYYLESLRAYASLGIGVGLARVTGYLHAEDDSVALAGTEYGKVGPSLQILLGKEWRVTKGWGMGVAAEYEFMTMDPTEDDGNLTIDIAHHWGIRFSGTFAGS
jgi:hypothetical protein